MGLIIYKDREKQLSGGVLVLLVSNLIVKIIGVFFKIPIVNIIGDEGMGYFNSAYTIYTLFYTLSTSGLPVAVSILVSGCIAKNNLKDKKIVYRITVLTFLIIGLMGSLFMLFGSRLLSEWIGNENSYICISAMSFVLLFVCISSAIRGYFQGHQNMFPTAISQIIESIGKLSIGIFLALYATRRGYSSYVVAAYAVLGITVSSAISMLYLLLVKNITDRNESGNGLSSGLTEVEVLKRLFKTAIPITVSSSVMSLTNILDLSMVMRRLLSIGYTPTAATAMYGNYSGLAVPLFNLPSAIVAPIALSVVPYITGARVQKNIAVVHSTIGSAIKSAAILSFPCMIGLYYLSSPILRLIFNNDQADRAAPLLSVLAMAIVGVSMTTVTTAILQACGKNKAPIISMILGSVVKIATGYLFIGEFGMVGTPLSTVCCYLVTSTVNFVFLKKYTDVKLDLIGMVLKPILASLVSCISARLVFEFLCNRIKEEIACVICLGLAACLYFFILLIIKAFNKEDTKIFPCGRLIDKYFLRGT